jgi:hypothetical protein
MPARVRLLLASLCLLIAPLVVMAGEFPGDTNTITSLTVEQAKQLAESFPGVMVHISGIGYDHAYEKGLPLRGLREFDVDVAKVLAKSNLNVLVLDGLTALDTECAKALAEFKGDLILNGLARLDTATAKALAEFRGNAEFMHDIMLNGLERASFGAVRVLRNRPNVYMPNPWYLLREQIAALVGTVVFVIMAGIVVWHSRRQRAAG